MARSITILLLSISQTILMGQSIKDTAALLFEQRKYQEALPKLELAFAESHDLQPLDTLAKIGLMLASAQEYLAKPSEAYQVLAKTYSMVYERDSTGMLIIRVLNRMAFNLINSLFQYEMSLGILAEAERIRTTYHDSPHRYHAQTQEYLAMAHHGIGDYDAVKEYLDLAQNLYEVTIDSANINEKGMFYNNAANLLVAQSDYKLAKSFYEKSLQILVPRLGQRHPTVGTIYNNLGDIYRQMYALDKAIDLGEMALSIAQENSLPVNEMLATHNLSIYHILANNYDHGIPLAEKALELCRENLGPDSYYMTKILDQLSHVYSQLAQHDTATKTAQRSLEIKLNIFGSVENASIAESYFAIAQTLSAQERYGEAEYNALQAMDIRKKLTSRKSKGLANSLFQLGDICLNTERRNEAREYYLSALKMMEQLPYSEDEQLDILARLGDLKRIEGDNQAAILLYLKGLHLVSEASPFESTLPPLQSIRPSPNLFLIFRGLLQCHFLQYLDSKDITDLELALDLAKLATDYLYEENMLGSSEAAQFIFGNFNRNIYHFALRIYWQAWQDLGHDPEYFEAAWQIMNRSTHQSLQAAIRQSDALTFANLPDSLIAKEQSLQQSIKLLEPRSAADSTLQLELAIKRVEYQELLDHFSQSYPEYYALRHQPQHASHRDVMSQLSDSTQLVRYLLGEGEHYLMSITNKTTQFLYVEIDSAISYSNWTDSLSLGLRKADCSLFSKYAATIYQHFLAPCIDSESKNLIIVPNDVLFRVNFEYLLENISTKHCRFSDLDYAINNFSFRYVYFPDELLEPYPMQAGKVLAVAPGFLETENQEENTSNTMGSEKPIGYAALPWSMQTAKELKSSLSADVMLGSKSSERAFKKSLSKYAIIHFGTHAEVDNENPLMSKLVLNPNEKGEDGFLHVHEIYALSLKANLVSLTACETGLGKIQAGEGMLSLARAFRYAGCPSVAMSLWKIDDQSSAGIMESFYQELATGKSKDTALHNAKTNYLKNHTGELKNPLYWAGMVLVGNADPVAIQQGSQWIWAVGLLLALAIFVIVSLKLSRVKVA